MAGGKLKRQVNNVWQNTVLKKFNGSIWENATIKRWNGVFWELLDNLITVNQDIFFALNFENNSFVDISQYSRIPYDSSSISIISGSRTNDLCAFNSDVNPDDKLVYTINFYQLKDLDGYTFEFDISIPDNYRNYYSFGYTGTSYVQISDSGSDKNLNFTNWGVDGTSIGVTITTNVFTHIAYVVDKLNGNIRIYKDGILVTTVNKVITNNFTNAVEYFGIFGIGPIYAIVSSVFKVDNIIITKTAKYTDNFTPHSGIFQ